jgi:hypothetical protein
VHQSKEKIKRKIKRTYKRIEIEWNKIGDKRIAIKHNGGMHCMAAHKKNS